MEISQVCFVLVVVCLLDVSATTCKGCISLDEHSFAKVTPRFKVSLVKFDVSYPYGDKHDAFVKFGDEQTNNKELLMAEIGIKDYGEKDNEVFARGYGVESTNLPAVKLFVNGANPVDFTEEITVENLRRFVMENSELHLVLPGCSETFDQLALKFMKDPSEENLAEGLALSEKEGEQVSKVYLAYMKKIMENGVKFVKTERSRLAKLLKEGKMAAGKREDLTHRLNILYSFKITHDEL